MINQNTSNSETSALLIPRLYERDIDVLIQEELVFNQATRLLFSQALDVPAIEHVHYCNLSVVDSTGETDLLVAFSIGDADCALLIENKIDAAFQPRQPERYRERDAQLVSDGKFNKVFCILISPESYIASKNNQTEHFDTTISYESLARSIQEEDTPRSHHRASLLLRAVAQARSSYILIPAEVMTDFWTRVYKFASERFPELMMAPPGPKGNGSTWIIFKATLPKRITIDWKFQKGTVDLSFWANAPHNPSSLVDLPELPIGSKIGPVGKAGTVALQVRQSSVLPLDINESSDRQINEALQTASDLLKLYHRAFD